MKKFLVLIALVFSSLFVSAPLANTAQVSAQAGALVNSHHSSFGGGKNLEASAILAPDGRLDVQMHIWNNSKLKGFHGCTVVTLRDTYGIGIGFSQPHRLWADGQWIGKHEARVEWVENIPADVVQKTVFLDVRNQECANDFWVNAQRAADHAKPVAEAVAALIAMFG